jgi:hypothetical protein
MAKPKSSTTKAATRGSTQAGGVVVPTVNIDRRIEAFHKCENLTSDLHGLLTCMLVVADSHEGGPVTRDEKECALSWLQWEAFKMSRDLQRAFA